LFFVFCNTFEEAAENKRFIGKNGKEITRVFISAVVFYVMFVASMSRSNDLRKMGSAPCKAHCQLKRRWKENPGNHPTSLVPKVFLT